MRDINFLSFVIVLSLSVLGLSGCATTSGNPRNGIENACVFSSGTWENGHCICGGETCDTGIMCNTITQKCANKVSCQPEAKAVQSGEEALSLWNADAVAKKELISYIETITKPGKDFIPVVDRIAVFDLDGTLLCETDPNYLDYNIFVYRVLEDPAYRDKATEKQIDIAQKIVKSNENGIEPEGLDVAHQNAYIEVFAGMTLPEYHNYVGKFLEQPAPGYEGMKRGESFYKPMLEVVKYLQANEFTVYIVSGTDRLQVRAVIDGKIDIPERQVIGSDGTIVAKGQEKTDDLVNDNLNYVYKEDDELVRGNQFIVKNLKMNKVAVIAQEIGTQPVLSFGNSTGDASMAEYVITNNRYPSRAFMLLADDFERENGNQAKADRIQQLCDKYGWIPVSMKNDWKTIYGENVTKKQ